ncbi:YbfB/YjiJ family MFS transporter [Ferrovibrio terrae]|uniref:YbfB/YjiJ family MFS transporter n=1 Tax=Ferrovibrio terrae TaxID=2594003 RepID=UPI0031383A03
MINPVLRNALAGFGALLLGLGLGRFGYTPLIPVLIQEGWLSAGAAAYLGATNLFGYVAGSLMAATLARLVPVPRLTRISMVVSAVSLIACAMPWGFVWFAPWRFLAGFAGGLLMVGAIPLILSRAPLAQRGRSNGIIFTGVGTGIITAGTLVPALAGWGPGPVWIGMGLLALLIAALTWKQWDGDTALPAPPTEAAPARAFTLPVALLLAAYTLDSAGFVPHTVFLADYVARGLERGVAAGGLYWVLFGVGAISGPLMVGFAAEWFGFYRSIIGVLTIKSAAIAIPLFSQHPVALAISAITVGAMTPGISALASGRVVELVGFGAHRKVWGWLTAGFAGASAGVGYLFSFLFDQTHSYNLLFALGAAGVFIAMLLTIFARKPKNQA